MCTATAAERPALPSVPPNRWKKLNLNTDDFSVIFTLFLVTLHLASWPSIHPQMHRFSCTHSWMKYTFAEFPPHISRAVHTHHMNLDIFFLLQFFSSYMVAAHVTHLHIRIIAQHHRLKVLPFLVLDQLLLPSLWQAQ